MIRERIDQHEMSISRCSQPIGLREITAWRISLKDLTLEACKVEETRNIKLLDSLLIDKFYGRIIATKIVDDARMERSGRLKEYEDDDEFEAILEKESYQKQKDVRLT